VTVGNHLRTYQSTARSLVENFNENAGAPHRRELARKLRHKLSEFHELIPPTIAALNKHVLDVDQSSS
jgi:hypothetical protein